jgi:hypothetical protein
MTTADHDNIEPSMFHVKHPYFPIQKDEKISPKTASTSIRPVNESSDPYRLADFLGRELRRFVLDRQKGIRAAVQAPSTANFHRNPMPQMRCCSNIRHSCRQDFSYPFAEEHQPLHRSGRIRHQARIVLLPEHPYIVTRQKSVVRLFTVTLIHTRRSACPRVDAFAPLRSSRLRPRSPVGQPCPAA